MTLTEGLGWELSSYCWLLKGMMLSIGLVLATGLWQMEKRAHYIAAWVLSLVGLGIAIWQLATPDLVCTQACGRALFALGNFGVTPIVMATTLFAVLFIMTSMMILRNRK
ncbi:MAG: hypothetical protein PHR51_02585 [Patescibacteria group bacterium]|nr:hypothetical protein [Patescibacteria group bacterium]